jgi:hypothetical protein
MKFHFIPAAKAGLFMWRAFTTRRSIATVLALTLAGSALGVHVFAARHAKVKVLGLDKVIAFTYGPSKDFDVKELHSATLVGPVGPNDWKKWQPSGVVTGVGHTWFDLLRSPLDKAVSNLAGQDFGGNPRPLAMVDELGFDYGGLMDQKAAQVLRQAKLKKPDLSLAVYEMRGPIPQVLAETYRDVADLVMFESYLHDQRGYWWIATQVWSARRYGILPKTIVILGVGKGGNPGEDWAETKEELEQQIRFVRTIAPESPGVGFFGGTPELLKSADAVCARYFHLPTNGKGLSPEALETARMFSRRYEKPMLVASPSFVEPNFKEDGSGLGEPVVMRPYIINLGDTDAKNVRVRLRNLPDLGGNVFAEGVIPVIPARGETVATLRVTDLWREWVGRWIMEIDAPGCDVKIYKF